MALSSGTRLGPYEIVCPLGVGGMGEVYRAHDTKLGRDVALKIVPELFASDRDRLARFTREAQALAALNHPNIAHIHGFEESGGVRALIMELVEGQDLAQRLVRGPIPLDEALPIARQIAEALEAAHEQGIIHRDLKPANIKVRDDGTVKVLDFGLAKVLPGEVGGSTAAVEPLDNSPTSTAPAMTGAGVILGTAAYMSPEQAKGRPADKRSDLWAFGCLLYEMLTGRRAFEGTDVLATMANVLTREPDWDRLPAKTPPAVQLLLRRCLRKDKRQRMQDAGSVRVEIEEALSAPIGSASAVSQGGRPARARVAVSASLASALIAGLAGWYLKLVPLPPPSVVTRVALTLPAEEQLAVLYPSLAVSPNGAHLVYVARRRGVQQLHLRPLDSLESTALVGTDGAAAPFFSPDSQWVGFFAGGKLKKISVTGSAPLTVCDARESFGGSWSSKDVIYFSPGGSSRLWQVSAMGGTPQPFTKIDPQKGEIGHRWPQVLPGGDAVLFSSRTGPGWDEWDLQVQRVSNGERHRLAHGGPGYYVPTEHLVYMQLATGTLVAVPFDPEHLQVGADPPVAVTKGILTEEGSHYTVSGNGVLAYVPGGSPVQDRTLVWVDRQGKVDPLNTPGRPYETPRLSPNGERLAFMTAGPTYDVWVYDFARGNATRLVSEGSNQYPIWTPDGKRVTYRATRTGTRNIFWRMADGGGAEERLTTGEGNHAPGSWSPNGDVLLFVTAGVGWDIMALQLPERETQPFVQTPFYEGVPQFSPDGRWVAYPSDESGRWEIYVRPYPRQEAKWQISTDGGTEPVWNPNGRELFYRSGNSMMAVDVTSKPVFRAGRPRVLFAGHYVLSAGGPTNYDVSPDGRRFLMVQRSGQDQTTPTQIVTVLNWFDELKRLAPTK